MTCVIHTAAVYRQLRHYENDASSHKADIVIEKFKRYKSPGTTKF